VLLELTVVEQRYDAVKEVLADGLTVTEVAERYQVARQTVHKWIAGTGREAWGPGRPVPPPRELPPPDVPRSGGPGPRALAGSRRVGEKWGELPPVPPSSAVVRFLANGLHQGKQVKARRAS
jgi:hypothetical protein